MNFHKLTRSQQTLESVQKQVEVGNAAKSDTLPAEADVANAQVLLLSSQNDFAVAEATLKNAMGLATYDPIILPGGSITAPTANPETMTLADYVKVAYDYRADLKQQQERVNQQGYQVKSAKISAGLTANVSVNEGYAQDPSVGETRGLTVSLSFPLFDAGSSRATVRSNKALLEQDFRQLDQQQQQVRLSVETAYLNREQARRRVVASALALRASQLSYEVSLEKKIGGLNTVLDVLNAQVQLVTAQTSNVQAIYDFYIAEAQLLRNIGLNDPAYRPRVPGAEKTKLPDSPSIKSLLQGGKSE